MISLRHAFISVWVSLLLLMAHATQASILSPQETIENSTSGVVKELGSLTVEQRTVEKIRELVLNWIIPIVDEQRVAMGALSKHWRTATPEQRKAFIELYRELQIKTYSGAFKAFDGEKIAVTETVYNPNGDKAIVKTLLKQKDGKEIPVDFRLYQKDSNSPWLVYDAVVAGLSLVKTYRDQLNEKLQNTSLEDFLSELSKQSAD